MKKAHCFGEFVSGKWKSDHHPCKSQALQAAVEFFNEHRTSMEAIQSKEGGMVYLKFGYEYVIFKKSDSRWHLVHFNEPINPFQIAASMKLDEQ